MTIKDIKTAVNNGLTVHWDNKNYEVIKGSNGEFYIKYSKSFAGHLTTLSYMTTTQGGETIEVLNGNGSDFFVELDLLGLVSGIEGKTIGDEICPQTGAVLGFGEYYYAVDERIKYDENAINDYCLKIFGEPYSALSVENPDDFYYSDREEVSEILSNILDECFFYMQVSDGTVIKANLSPYINDY